MAPSLGSDSDIMIRCHYEVLGVDRNADASVIKKAHRKLALQLHPDKNIGGQNDDAEMATQFRRVQQAYECLSDPQERQWYDEHREAILRGWDGRERRSDGADDFIFDVVPFMHPGCYEGTGDDVAGFYQTYQRVFTQIYTNEVDHSSSGNMDALSYLETDFGDSSTTWEHVARFYQSWESYGTVVTFAWTDVYDIREAPNRAIRRAMEDENKKARKAAKKERNDDVLALVRFVKRRDPRVVAYQERNAVAHQQRQQQRETEQVFRKQEAQQAREQWRVEAQAAMARTEQEDQAAGRIRLADLDDDYDYGGKGKSKKKGWRKIVESTSSDEAEDEQRGSVEVDDADLGNYVEVTTKSASASKDGASDDESSPHIEEAVLSSSDTEEEEEELDVWRCECCRKDFKSAAQLENHMKSKKHKEAFKKLEKRAAG